MPYNTGTYKLYLFFTNVLRTFTECLQWKTIISPTHILYLSIMFDINYTKRLFESTPRGGGNREPFSLKRI